MKQNNEHSAHRRLTDEIRKKQEPKSKQPWHKSLGKRLERANKRLTYPLLGKLLRLRKRQEKIDLSEIKSVLFLRPDVIGDMICTTPLWRILKKQAPHLELGVLASFRNADVVRADPDLTRIHVINRYDKEQTKRTLKEVRSFDYDAVVICKLDRLVEAAILARRCTKTGWTIGISIHPEIRHDLLFSMAPFMPREVSAQHMTDQLLFILEQAFVLKPVAPEERRPSLFIDEQVLGDTQHRLNAMLAANGSTECVVINTQARNDFLEWGYKNSIDLAEKLTHNYSNLSVIFTSSPEREQQLQEALAARQLGSRIVYFKTPDLHNLFSLIRLSKLVITPDTSAIHIATAEKKPTIGFYPRATNWQPYQVPGYKFLPTLDQPVRTIGVERVFQAATDLLDQDSNTIRNVLLHTVQT